MNKTLIVCIIAFFVMASYRASQAPKVLKKAGYSQITTTGYRFLGCDTDDLFHTGFKAIGPTGYQVEGVVCSGLFQSSTIRID